jgi:hypothetical protein
MVTAPGTVATLVELVETMVTAPGTVAMVSVGVPNQRAWPSPGSSRSAGHANSKAVTCQRSRISSNLAATARERWP